MSINYFVVVGLLAIIILDLLYSGTLIRTVAILLAAE